jgi:GT2 family glycosyltransferase
VEKSISIVIATSGRVEKIRRLLEALSRVEGRERIEHDIVIANNAPDDATAAAVDALVREFAARNDARCWQVREPVPGKCRAQNKTIPQTKGAIVAFLDDDVEVTASWLEAIDTFFKSYPHDVMQGAILMRPEDRQNEKLQQLLYRYRTVDFIEYGFPTGADLQTLTGGNIAVRREVFDQAGLFDARLGPGGYGISEDVEFAK